jgi:hypothetical protein
MGERQKDLETAQKAHGRNLRSAIDAFKRAIERDTLRAPAGMKLDARSGMWEFAQIRKETEEEIRRLSGYFTTGLPLPSGFEAEFWKVCVALYLVERTEKMLEESVKLDKPSSVALFCSAKEAVGRVLDSFYYFKPLDGIVDDYMDGEVAIAACAESCGVKLIPFESVMKEYEERVRLRINAINGLS